MSVFRRDLSLSLQCLSVWVFSRSFTLIISLDLQTVLSPFCGSFPFLNQPANYWVENWRRQWQHTPVLLPGKSHGRRSPVGCSPWVSKSRTWLSDFTFTFTFNFHAWEKEMATHSSALAWRIPGTEEPSGLPSIGSHRVRHDWSDLAADFDSDFTSFSTSVLFLF